MSLQEKSPLKVKGLIMTNNDNFSTPYRQDKTNKDKYRFKLLSSGKGNSINCNTENHNCLSNFCQCPVFDSLLKKVVMSPSTNFLFQSPTSLNNYVESLTKAKITIITNNITEYNQQLNDIKTNENFIDEEKLNVLNNVDVNDNILYLNELKDDDDKINVNLFNDSNIKTKISKTESKYSSRNTPRNLWDELNETNNSLNLFLSEDENDNRDDLSRTNSILGIKREISFSDSNYESPLKIKNKNSSFITNKDLEKTPSTLFNTEKSKKSKKRNRKSREELQQLQELYEKSINKDWSKEDIIEVSLKTGLNKNKIYKWLWDKKNKALLLKKDKFMIVTD